MTYNIILSDDDDTWMTTEYAIERWASTSVEVPHGSFFIDGGYRVSPSRYIVKVE